MSVTDAEIERLSRRRQEIWNGARSDAGEVARIARSLAGLYEEKRREGASDAGSPAEIAKRARVEAELERLMAA